MKEYIEREAIKSGMIRYGFTAPDMTVTEFVEDELPAADVVEAMHGRWEERIVDDPLDPYGFFKRRWYCSSCGRYQTYGTTAFCPRCGARMDGGVNDATD